MRTILHIDMDAFFAAVEVLHHPEWRGKPLVVGAGPHERGVVSTCSYEARKFGVRSAMPSREAYRLCPHAIFTHPRMKLYSDVSKRVFEIFEHYTPYVEGVSIDEAFLDITGSIHLHGSARALGEALRREVRETCGVTCSVGIAPNRLLAKIGSEENKPDGLTLMPTDPASVAAFLAPKPLGVLWGVGRKTKELLRPYGLVTCGDVQRLVGADPHAVWADKRAGPPASLVSLLGDAAAAGLAAAVFGLSDDAVDREGEDEKSVSREHTFETDADDRETVRQTYLELVTEVGRRFRRDTRWARTARLKLRDTDFRTFTRQLPFPAPARDDFAFRAAALELFDAVWPKGCARAVRLVGFGVTNIQPTPDAGAPSLFADPADDARKKRERLSDALDALRDRSAAMSYGVRTR